MTDSMQLTSSGWSSFVVILAVTIPCILFWNPLRRLINEYRLYRRCQQYPHILVCKENSSTTISERKSGDGISCGFILIGRFLFNVLIWFHGVMMDIFLVVFSHMSSQLKSTTTGTPVPQLSSSKKLEDRTMNSTHVGNEAKSALRQPLHLSTYKEDLDIDDRVQRSQKPKHNFKFQIKSEDMFESPFENTEKVDLSMQRGQLALAPLIQQRESELNPKINSIILSRPPNHRIQYQIIATISTADNITQSVDIESTSLSEKMRKRRLNEVSSKGNNVVSEQDNRDISRKRRKLNIGRMPLQGCVARRPTEGAWRTTKILDKREREEREERLLRGMSRKRMKTADEKLKQFASLPISTTEPVSSTPAFNFGQIAAESSTGLTTSINKHETAESVSTGAPTYQYGANGNASSKSSKREDTTGAAKKKSESAANASTTFSFGNTSVKKTNTTPKTQAQASLAPTPATQYQFSGSSGGANDESKTKARPAEQSPPKFGITPSTTTSSAAPSFGATQLASTQALPGFSAVDPASSDKGASSTQVAPIPSFGATPAPLTHAPAASGSITSAAPSFVGKVATASAAPSSFGVQPPATQTFGVTTAPPITFGAPPAPASENSFGSTSQSGGAQFGSSSDQPTSALASSHQSISQGFNSNPFGSQPSNLANTQQISFGNTKENTNPGSFNSTFQTSAPSNSFVKPLPTNGNFTPPLGMNGDFSAGISNGAAIPGFDGGNANGMPGFSACAPPVVATGASARRMARKSRNRRR